jgi:hypothetical protein
MKRVTDDTVVYMSDIDGSAELLVKDVEAMQFGLDEADNKVADPTRLEKRIDEIAGTIFKAHMQLESIVEELQAGRKR